jgi:hypothetical protein
MNLTCLVILTNDYEVFGNGTGHVEHCLIKPTEKLLELCSKHEVPVTLFADIAEYWAFEEEEGKKAFSGDYLPASKIRNQLIHAIKTGHDVQLHLHPQWLNYAYDAQTGWKLDLNMWRLPSLPYGNCGDRLSILGALDQAKKTLQDILKPASNDYECIAFRAGAWCIQPESEVLRALKDIGIKIDSTVVPGLSFNNGITEFDFRSCISVFKEKAYWYISEYLNRPGFNDCECLIEVPILSVPYFIHKRFANKLKRKRLGLFNNPLSCRGTILSKELQDRKVTNTNLFTKILNKIKRQEMVDFTIASADEMYYAVKQAIKMYKGKFERIPIVFISHSKVLGNENLRELERFILTAKAKGILFGKYGDVLNWEAEKRRHSGCN